MRVVHCVRSDAFAGVERYVTNLAVGLAQAGVEVVVVGGEPDRMHNALAPAGIQWLGATSTTGVLRRLIGLRPVDIVHAHMTAAEVAAVLAVPALRAPIVATRHFAQHRGSSPAARMVGRLLTPRLAAQLAISQYVAERTEGASVVVPPGTWPRPDGPGPAGRQPAVLLAQRLEPEKRTDLGLLAWQASGLADRGWRLWIAGTGQELGRLEAPAVHLGVRASCDFFGFRADVNELLVQASILLAPRPDEPYGLSVLEAMAAGLPVVAAGEGGHLETIGMVDGAALYPPTDTIAAGHLLLDLAVDPARRAAYGRAERDTHARRFTVAKEVAATLEVYHRLLPLRVTAETPA